MDEPVSPWLMGLESSSASNSGTAGSCGGVIFSFQGASMITPIGITPFTCPTPRRHSFYYLHPWYLLLTLVILKNILF